MLYNLSVQPVLYQEVILVYPVHHFFVEKLLFEIRLLFLTPYTCSDIFFNIADMLQFSLDAFSQYVDGEALLCNSFL